jgi:metal-responsive CopG/Arc/MetJ family transcriptional regulator
MPGSSRFTVSVPTTLLRAVDEKLVNGQGGRSALVRRLLEEALREAEEREEVARYVRSYRETPQTDEEGAWTERAARERLGEVPWE